MTLNVLAKIEPALAAQGGSPRTAMRATSCSVSRSVEEAALDPEWPGPPICNYKQTTLQLVKRPPPPSVTPPPKTIATPKLADAANTAATTRARSKRESRTFS